MKKSKNLTEIQKENCKVKINLYTDCLLKSSDSYNKAILGLSTASLGYTFLAPKYLMICFFPYPCALYFSWFFLILSIIAVLISFVADQFNSLHRINYYSWCIAKKEFKEKYKKSDRKKSHWSDDDMLILPILSGACFFFGIFSFMLFVSKMI